MHRIETQASTVNFSTEVETAAACQLHVLSWTSGDVTMISYPNKMAYSGKHKHGITWESPISSNFYF